jgi:hypothetical protein
LIRTDNDWVDQTIEFHYLTHGALDFCPGNTPKKSAGTDPQDGCWGRYKYNTLLTDLNRLEASGMARDIGFDVRYHRTTKRVAKVPSTQ